MRIRSEDITWQDVDGEIVVLDLKGSTYLKLNGSAAVLWNRLASGCDDEDLTRALTAEYDVDEATARQDAQAFLDDLDGAGLLDRTE